VRLASCGADGSRANKETYSSRSEGEGNLGGRGGGGGNCSAFRVNEDACRIARDHDGDTRRDG
jgi:hypothetical protein